jgi:two-component sensor histidine kinase
MAMTLEKGRRFQGQEMLVDREQGGTSHVIAYPEPLYDSAGNLIGAVNLLVDITERKTAEQRLKASLEEKEVLLKEIHHRVKNNLQVVSSLLYLQSQKIEDPEVRALFAESQNRICSMALAHEQLYQSKSLADISLREYVHSLVSHMRQVNMLPESRIECEVLVADVTVDIEKVVPCGLLIAELFSNAIKHAFPDGRRGMVRIEISSRQRDVKLSVADDGVGLPAGFDYRHTQTLGLQLVCALVAQLDGDISLVDGAGTRFDIIFPVGSP